VTEKTQLHLDRCLTCRSCETTCPSGVQYGKLIDIGRFITEKMVPRGYWEKFSRWLLRKIISYSERMAMIVWFGQLFKIFLPKSLARKVPDKSFFEASSMTSHERKMLILDGCAQRVVTPATNVATANVLNKLGIELIETKKAGCCGAVSHHLSAEDEALDFMRHNIDVWWPFIEENKVEALVVTASGCGVTIKEYGSYLEHDANYAEKASVVSSLAKDLVEILSQENLTDFKVDATSPKISYQSPCTLQHGQQLSGQVEALLSDLGFQLLPMKDPHLCCGSAGTYSLLQADFSQKLLNNKLANLTQHQPDIIATANVGCQLHLSTQATIPVKHWIELLDSMSNT
jgi:glycolate oxidase iron-sulfur subunit